MTSNNLGLRLIALRHVYQPVLLAGLLIGGVSVFAGPAQANIVRSTCNFTALGGCTGSSGSGWLNGLALGDKLLNIVSYTFNTQTNLGPAVPTGHFDFTWIDADNVPGSYLDDNWNVSTTFDTPVTGDGANNATGTLNYTLDIIGSGLVFNDVELDSSHTGTGGIVTKDIPGVTQLVSNNGNPDGPVPVGGTSLNVTATYSMASTGALDSFNDTYTQTHHVPGPLPLVGVGAALSFSRRLRNRIKGVRRA